MAEAAFSDAAIQNGLPEGRARKTKDGGATMRNAVAPTDTYVASNYVNVQLFSTIRLAVSWDASVDFTSLQVWVESADTASDTAADYQSLLQYDAIASSLTPATPLAVTLVRAGFETAGGGHIVISNSTYNFLRVRVKRTGGTTVGTVTVKLYGGVGV